MPYGPGGGSDSTSRIVAKPLGEVLGQQIVIDNRPGAGTIIGAELAAKSPPDGYTIFSGITGTMAINPSIYAKLPYDPVKDFVPISMVAVGPNVLAVHPSVPAKNVKELIVLAKSHPGQLSYASSGVGGALHLVGDEVERFIPRHAPEVGAALRAFAHGGMLDLGGRADRLDVGPDDAMADAEERRQEAGADVAVLVDRHGEHGAAMAVWGMGVMVGPILGPTIGGYLTEYYSWRWVFYVNLPFGLLAAAGLAVFLPSGTGMNRLRFDWFGFGMLSIGIGSFQLMLDRGQDLDWFSSREIQIEAGIAAIAGPAGNAAGASREGTMPSISRSSMETS